MSGELKKVLMPADPPDDLSRSGRAATMGIIEGTMHEFDEELFDLCRDDDYAGIYRLFVERYAEKGL